MAKYEIENQMIDTDADLPHWDGGTPDYKESLYLSAEGVYVVICKSSSLRSGGILSLPEVVSWFRKWGFELPADLQAIADGIAV